MLARVSLLALGFICGCASSAPPPVVDLPPPEPVAMATDAAVPPPPAPPELEVKNLTEKQWWEQVSRKLSTTLQVPATDLRFSPNKQLVTFVYTPPARGRHPAPSQIVVVDLDGRRRARFRPVRARGSDDPPKDLRFLGDDRLVYEVVAPPVKKPRKRRPRPAANKVTLWVPSVPSRFFVVQRISPRPKVTRCVGSRFAFTEREDRVAFVGGPPASSFVAVDGAQVYPRKGRTLVVSDLAWSRDGRSLAFVEARATGPARLVLLAEFDNPTGDTTWDLPTTVPLEGLRVFWSGAGTLTVGKSALKPALSVSFSKEGGT